ncbi:MAG: hypothetical protein AB4372_12455 [Xenococcus sp. (in: cyanobacteria)]
MENPKIEFDLADILKEIQSDQKRMFQEIQSDQKSMWKEMQSGQKEILKEISDIKLEIADVKGDIKSLNTKVEQLDKRIGNQEFTNRGVLVGLILLVLGGVIKLFELGNF